VHEIVSDADDDVVVSDAPAAYGAEEIARPHVARAAASVAVFSPISPTPLRTRHVSRSDQAGIIAP
jgi:hypothetical protein